ncbi:heavy metal translocating P-type ATPase [Duganella sp. FT3S]|uniref:P-type Zn(2+) transporter n=1 Tax=Rugamonas fusca TaxID=2758568 RepID=A0A7W2EJ16_9BURK|nr:heavy metal translocating P-type ATPase [Rugamonas fusca]MBA5606806.1 heavy metal translocating P-type ATPase [Rugamonas fusca]
MNTCDGKDCCGDATAPAAAAPAAAASAERAVFMIQNMDCPTEEKLIRDRLRGMAGVDALQFNLMRRELTVDHHLPTIAPLVAVLTALDMAPAVVSSSQDALAAPDAQAAPSPAPRAAGTPPFGLPRWLPLAVSGLAALAAEGMAWSTGHEHGWPVLALAVTAIVCGGLGTLKKGWIALRNLSLNMNFLMSLAILGALAIGQWPEAAMVIFLFALAERIEARSLDRARHAIRGMMALTPDTATVQAPSGAWQRVAAAQVQPGALVRVTPGERIALDGVVAAGESAVNQAPITGESMPVAKLPGDTVFAGTINEQGSFDYTVTAPQSQSTLSRIVSSVQQAQGERAPTQRFVDRFAASYIPVVVALAVLVAVVPPLALGADIHAWFYRALVLLVIACPCALVISTPVTVVSGLAAAARHGILVKGGVYLELGRKLRAVALDKTGTLTLGTPQVTDVVVLDGGEPLALLHRAASLAALSAHPVSRALVQHWHGAQREVALAPVARFEALQGRGIRGEVEGDTLYLGNARLVRELGVRDDALAASLATLERDGKSVVVLCSATAALLVVAVADTVRATSAEAVAQLHALGVRVVMLSGDNVDTARAVGARLGIADVRAGLLPDDKLRLVTALAAEHGAVGMVGDGVNDAPALAQAAIGFAMGAAGTDTAMETANVALMDDDLRKVAWFMRLSARTHAILVQNIVLALAIKAVFLVLAVAGYSTLWMAVFADMGVSLMVVLNGLRLLRGPAPMPVPIPV